MKSLAKRTIRRVRIFFDGMGDILKNANPATVPSDHYLETVDLLDNVVRECMHVSKSYGGIPSPTTRHFYASVLFTALVTRGATLAILMPHTPWAKKIIEHWDYASMATLTRTMLETRVAFFYLCSEECSHEEWECRWNLFNLHDCSARIKLFNNMDPDSPDINGFEEQAEELRERLRNNSHFQSLTEKQQANFLRGRDAYLYPLEEIAESAGIEKKIFRFIYVMFSANVHSLPMSFYRMQEGERGRGLPSEAEEGYTSMCLSFAATMLVQTRDEVHELFRDLTEANA